jgi:hypothetical protein
MKFMRKLNYFLGLAAIGGLIFMNSCSKDNAKGPSLYITGDSAVTTAANTTITIEWSAYAGDANLDKITIEEGNTPITGWNEKDIPSSENENYSGSVNVNIGTTSTQFTITVIDKDGNSASKTVNVTVTSPLTTLGTSQLGASGSSLGSYYSISGDAVYTTGDLTAGIANTVDFVFNVDGSNAIFKSPKDATNTLVHNSGRTTNYQKVTLDFDNATAESIVSITPSADNITVAQGDIVVFKTQDNVKGVFKVNALTVATDGTVTIDIKIKE